MIVKRTRKDSETPYTAGCPVGYSLNDPTLPPYVLHIFGSDTHITNITPDILDAFPSNIRDLLLSIGLDYVSIQPYPNQKLSLTQVLNKYSI